ncbi:NADP-dependent oxidoreductase domain-containing protein [Pilobolus umbonatus]|nr:NADP-dependent oxidoreductase domain-containing protein [Pilobolus umbonatus]
MLILFLVGTYQMKTRKELHPSIFQAIQSGYRLIDTATVYRNEEIIGKILKEVFEDTALGVKREDLFITSKLAPQDQGYDKCYQAVLTSLKKLELDYLDLYLIHWPGSSKTDLSDPINQKNRSDSYRALEKLYQEGKVKHIGISNYTPEHMKQLLSTCTIIPHVHQFELHPCLYQTDIIDLCTQNKIIVQAYSSLGEGKLINGEVRVAALEEISKRMNVSTALILLRWAIQHEWIIIPKSKNPERVKENAEVWSIKLSDEDMKALDDVHKSQPHRFCWDPFTVA